MITYSDFTMGLSELLEASHPKLSYFLRRTVPESQANRYDAWRNYRETRQLVDKYLDYGVFDEDGLPQVTGIAPDDRYDLPHQPVILDLTSVGGKLGRIGRSNRFVEEDKRRDIRSSYKGMREGGFDIHDLYEKIMKTFAISLYQKLYSMIVDGLDIERDSSSAADFIRYSMPSRIDAFLGFKNVVAAYLNTRESIALSDVPRLAIRNVGNACYKKAEAILDDQLATEQIPTAVGLISAALALADMYHIELRNRRGFEELKAKAETQKQRLLG